ncbi:MAG: type I methionyl aminopeptidase [Candidatus Eremiobacteraeota bacterium]|nr:type I methionyl aminopeptidase [Candidatus Eremiobacteraeota bacterium]
MITCKSSRELDRMRTSGRITARALEKLALAVRPGVTTKAINDYADELIRAEGAEPAFLGYHGFAGSVCTSVNEQIVHGIPGPRTLREGDLLKIDIGSCADGWYSDMAATLPVGQITPAAQALLDTTRAALVLGIEAVRPDAHVSDIGYAVQTFVESRGYAVVRALVGHGIGTALHEEPPVPNFGRRGTGVVLKPGMVVAIEPMVNIGTFRVKTLDDKWTVVTADGSLSAHYEHTVAVTPDGFEILTLTDAQARPNYIPDALRHAAATPRGAGADESAHQTMRGEHIARQTPGRIQAIG